MKRQREDQDQDLPEHNFEATPEDLATCAKLEKIFEANNILQVMLGSIDTRWDNPPILNHVFQCFNAFGLTFLYTIPEDGRLKYNAGRAKTFSRWQMDKLARFGDQIMVFKHQDPTIDDMLEDAEEYEAVSVLMKNSPIHFVLEIILAFVGLRCGTFRTHGDALIKIHNQHYRSQEAEKAETARIRRIVDALT
jgi:hypothetical protein